MMYVEHFRCCGSSVGLEGDWVFHSWMVLLRVMLTALVVVVSMTVVVCHLLTPVVGVVVRVTVARGRGFVVFGFVFLDLVELAVV